MKRWPRKPLGPLQPPLFEGRRPPSVNHEGWGVLGGRQSSTPPLVSRGRVPGPRGFIWHPRSSTAGQCLKASHGFPRPCPLMGFTICSWVSPFRAIPCGQLRRGCSPTPIAWPLYWERTTPPPNRRSGVARITLGNGPTRYDGHDRFALRQIRCERHRQRSTGCGRSAAQWSRPRHTIAIAHSPPGRRLGSCDPYHWGCGPPRNECQSWPRGTTAGGTTMPAWRHKRYDA